jgi:NADPH2:quinone reductase
MKAIVITGKGGPEVLKIWDLPTPEPRGGQVRIRVRACGLNRADLLQARGMYPAPPGAPTDIPGLEFAGEVDALGPDVIGPLKLGDRVFGIVGGGGQAEYVLTHERMAIKIPPNIDFVAAAAVPEAFITAQDALLTQGRVAHAMGCTVVGTTRSADKLDRLKSLGLDHGIDTSHEDFAAVVNTVTEGRGVNVVVDLIGGAVLAGNLAALTPRGRLVLVGLLAGTTGALDLNLMLRKRLNIVGTTLRARPLDEKIAASQRFGDQIGPWLERGLVCPIVDSIFAFDDFHAAQERLESNQVFGKVILRL